MTELKILFEDYGGDYTGTMSRFLGNENLYYKILPKLFQDDNLQKLGEALNAGNLDDAFMAAHTLKGVSANLGLIPLYDAVCAIVEPLRRQEQGAAYTEMYQTIQKEFQRVDELWKQLQKGKGQDNGR